jgi:hypothetical protein
MYSLFVLHFMHCAMVSMIFSRSATPFGDAATRRVLEGKVHMPTISVQTHGDIIELEVLRMLWVFHFASTAQLARLVWGENTDWNKQRLRRTLEPMLRNDLIWREPFRISPGFRSHAHGKTSGGWFYGITQLGRAKAVHHLPQLAGVHCLTREGFLTDSERRIMQHSLNYTEYCTGLIDALRAHPLTAGMFFDTECTRLGSHLRMDGLFRLRLRRTLPQQAEQSDQLPWFVPWLTTLRSPLLSTHLDVTFAIEIDQGSEELKIIERKAENYMRTYGGGLNTTIAGDQPTVAWHEILCPPGIPNDVELRKFYFPITVFIVPGAQRMVNVLAAWQRGWPTSEIRVTSWQHIHETGSIVKAPYLNRQHGWVDLLGRSLPYSGRIPQVSA